jgi:hypothetical protein
MQKTERLTAVKYNFYNIEFKPYAHLTDKYTSQAILKESIQFLSNIKNQGKGYMADKNANRANTSPRKVFMISCTKIHQQRRYRCTMALIRKGRLPKLMNKETFELKSISNLGEIVELTNFFIDVETDKNIICLEQNHHGPGIGDIEHYFKKIARDEKQLAKQTKVDMYMKNSLQETQENLKNVLSFNIKMRSSNLDLVNKDFKNTYMTGFQYTKDIYKPVYLRMEAFFKRNGRATKERKENIKATSMFSSVLNLFKSDATQSDYFDKFVVEYEDSKGAEQTFNLLDEKEEVIKQIPENKDLKLKESYELIATDFTEFINTL